MNAPILVLLISAGLALGACSEREEQITSAAAPSAAATNEAGSAREPKTFALDADDNGKSLSLIEGDKIALTLETNPGTGYSWEYEGTLDAEILKEVSDETAKAESSPGMVGVPELRTWTYDAVGEGSTTVTLGYRPPGRDEAEETFTFSVSVTG